MQKQNTKKLISAIIILVVLLLSYCISEFGFKKQNNNQEIIQLERCVDGDTFVASTKKFGSTKIRLSGVNTPEISHPGYGIKEEYYGKEAKAYTCNRLKSAQSLTVEWDNTQEASHERQIAIVFIDGKNYNLELFQEGYSNDRYLKNKMPYAEQYRKALEEAQRDKKGMWTK